MDAGKIKSALTQALWDQVLAGRGTRVLPEAAADDPAPAFPRPGVVVDLRGANLASEDPQLAARAARIASQPAYPAQPVTRTDQAAAYLILSGVQVEDPKAGPLAPAPGHETGAPRQALPLDRAAGLPDAPRLDPYAGQAAVVIRFPDGRATVAEQTSAAAAVTQRPIAELTVPFLVRQEPATPVRHLNRLMLAVVSLGVILVGVLAVSAY